jgi:hypothetical protein
MKIFCTLLTFAAIPAILSVNVMSMIDGVDIKFN